MLGMFQKLTGRESGWSSVGKWENPSRWSQRGTGIEADKPGRALGTKYKEL